MGNKDMRCFGFFPIPVFMTQIPMSDGQFPWFLHDSIGLI